MKSIKTLTDVDFGLVPITFDKPRIRLGARGIIFNKDNKIAVLFKRLKNEYKLIGGGIDEKEDPQKAFLREALEESGCKIVIDDTLGIIEELKSQDNFMQKSYVYIGHVIEETPHQHFTKQELDEGAKLIWCTIEEALNLIKDSENKLLPSKHESDMSVYHTKFIVRRDYEILKYYINKFLNK